MNKEQIKHIIARRVAEELEDGYVVNLGIGLPTLVPLYLSKDKEVTLQSENGFIDIGPEPEAGGENPYLVNAGGRPASILPGGAVFSSDTSFGIIRGGHVDATVLGALQVDAHGNLANWMIPGKLVPGMGGAMDLLVGARKVIVAMEHTSKGAPKILNHCTLPLTAKGQVDMIITEMGVFEIHNDQVVIKEKNPRYTVKEIQDATEAHLTVAEELTDMFHYT